MTAETLFRWSSATRSCLPTQDQPNAYIIDSWLVDNGKVRSLGSHAARFRAACMQVAPQLAGEVDAFFAASIAHLPTQGRWFPRAELALPEGEPRLYFRMRSARERATTIRLWLAREPDERIRPRTKGPDLAYLMALRQEAVSNGADEAVLLSSDGKLLEGSTSSLMWWHEDTLCAPPVDGLLPGVTRETLFRLAEAHHVPTHRTALAAPAELSGCEIWAVNALHGIRHVTGWAGTSVVPAEAARASQWNRYLDGLAEPVDVR